MPPSSLTTNFVIRLRGRDYLYRIFYGMAPPVVGGTYIYCTHPVSKLDKLGRKTRYTRECNSRFTTEAKYRRHFRKMHQVKP